MIQTAHRFNAAGASYDEVARDGRLWRVMLLFAGRSVGHRYDQIQAARESFGDKLTTELRDADKRLAHVLHVLARSGNFAVTLPARTTLNTMDDQRGHSTLHPLRVQMTAVAPDLPGMATLVFELDGELHEIVAPLAWVAEQLPLTSA